MVFWILISLLTGAAALTVLVPLSGSGRSRARAVGAPSADEAVYREQLEAIDTELSRGLIDAGAAEAARTEIARRLLAAHDKQAGLAMQGAERPRLKLAQGAALLALPVAAFGLYLLLGSPDQPDLPLSARLTAPAGEQSVEILVARVERHLAGNPEDGEGWAVIAPVYLTIGRPQASARAYANAIRLLGARPDWLTDFGEALTVASQGLVTADARRAFEQAVDLDPGAVKPRFFLAIALGQEGKTAEAIAAWERLLAGADETASWTAVARGQLSGLKDGLKGGSSDEAVADAGKAAPGLAGPTQQDIAASSDMSAEDRQAMIRGMVSGLDERLAADGGSAAEWNRLIRAYMVLGERQSAEAALARAEAAYAENPDDLLLIKDAASKLGLKGS